MTTATQTLEAAALTTAMMTEYKRQRDQLEITVVALRNQVADLTGKLAALEAAARPTEPAPPEPDKKRKVN